MPQTTTDSPLSTTAEEERLRFIARYCEHHYEEVHGDAEENVMHECDLCRAEKAEVERNEWHERYDNELRDAKHWRERCAMIEQQDRTLREALAVYADRASWRYVRCVGEEWSNCADMWTRGTDGYNIAQAALAETTAEATEEGEK